VAPEQPDYGPRGYLPPKAAKRARKIILREPMGLQWAIAAVIAGMLVLAAGGVLLLLRSGPPAAPFAAVGEIAQIDPRGAGTLAADGGRAVLVLRGAGGVAVFDDPGTPLRWCAPRSRLIADTGAVWQADGRLVGGTGRSLARVPAQVHDGVLYVDTRADGTRLESRPQQEPTTCPSTPG
jgi:hypothetical protein